MTILHLTETWFYITVLVSDRIADTGQSSVLWCRIIACSGFRSGAIPTGGWTQRPGRPIRPASIRLRRPEQRLACRDNVLVTVVCRAAECTLKVSVVVDVRVKGQAFLIITGPLPPIVFTFTEGAASNRTFKFVSCSKTYSEGPMALDWQVKEAT